MECKTAFKIHIHNRHDGKFYPYEPQAQCPLAYLKLQFSKKSLINDMGNHFRESGTSRVLSEDAPLPPE